MLSSILVLMFNPCYKRYTFSNTKRVLAPPRFVAWQLCCSDSSKMLVRSSKRMVMLAWLSMLLRFFKIVVECVGFPKAVHFLKYSNKVLKSSSNIVWQSMKIEIISQMVTQLWIFHLECHSTLFYDSKVTQLRAIHLESHSTSFYNSTYWYFT